MTFKKKMRKKPSEREILAIYYPMVFFGVG